MPQSQKKRAQKISKGINKGARRANIAHPPASLVRHRPRVKDVDVLIKKFLADEIDEATYKHGLRQISKRNMRPTVGMV